MYLLFGRYLTTQNNYPRCCSLGCCGICGRHHGNYLVLNSIPKKWKDIIRDDYESSTDENDRISLEIITSTKKVSQYVYNFHLSQENPKEMLKYAAKWYSVLGMEINLEEYLCIFRQLYETTHVIKLRNFQYRLLLGKIYANDTLYKWKIKSSDKCENCNEKQTWIHMLYYCECVQDIWKYVQDKCKQSEILTWKLPNVLSNSVHPKTKNVVNTVILFTKQFIYKNKCMENKPVIKNLIDELELFIKIETHNATKGETTDSWRSVLNLLKS